MWEIRRITEDEIPLFQARLARAFGGDPDVSEDSIDRFLSIFELDRLFGVFDEGDLVGTGGAFSFEVTVPGGTTVPMGGTTVVTIQATHRRRGALRALMERHLDEVSKRGDLIAGLWASESTIYWRFGYGPATYRYETSIDAAATETSSNLAGGAVHLVEKEEASRLLPQIYERTRQDRSGMLSRHAGWWSGRRLADRERDRGGKTAHRYLVHETDREADGYAIYRQKSKWDNFVAEGEIDVIEVIAGSTTAHVGLWSYLTNVDLFPQVGYWNLPVDHPLPLLLSDERRVRRTISDAMWVRLIDVKAALEARAYESDGLVTFELDDEARPGNSGIYRLEVSDGNASCESVDVAADIALASGVLGHLYLGGGDALAMAAAGRITGDPESVRTLHRLMRTDLSPWCPEVF